MKISAVVVTYNRQKILLECIRSILKQTYPVEQIIIVDNASTDGTREALSQEGILDNPKVLYIPLKVNEGGAGGFYYGSKQAYKNGADWIWMMDDDCIPSATAVQNLINAANIVEASFFNSAKFSEDGSCINCVGIEDLNEGLRYLDRGIVSVSFAPFVSFFFCRDAIETCGLPYKNFFIYGDDFEYSRRLIQYYKPGYLVGTSIVKHGCGVSGGSPWESDDKNRIERGKYLIRNSLMNQKEYGNRKERLKLYLGHTKLFFGLIFGKRKKRFMKIGQIIRGYWEYMIGSYDRKAFRKRFTNHIDTPENENI